MKQNTLLKDNYLYYCNTWPLGLSMALFIVHPASVSTWVSNLEALRLFNNSNRGVCQLTTVLFLFQPSFPIISPNMVICLAMQDISVKHLIWSCSLPPNIFVFARLQVWPDLEMASKKRRNRVYQFHCGVVRKCTPVPSAEVPQVSCEVPALDAGASHLPLSFFLIDFFPSPFPEQLFMHLVCGIPYTSASTWCFEESV